MRKMSGAAAGNGSLSETSTEADKEREITIRDLAMAPPDDVAPQWSALKVPDRVLPGIWSRYL